MILPIKDKRAFKASSKVLNNSKTNVKKIEKPQAENKKSSSTETPKSQNSEHKPNNGN